MLLLKLVASGEPLALAGDVDLHCANASTERCTDVHEDIPVHAPFALREHAAARYGSAVGAAAESDGDRTLVAGAKA